MQIVHVPHQTLRKTAAEVKTVDKQLLTFIGQLEKTLKEKRKPRGVGLSAPQVDESLAVFVTYLPQAEEDTQPTMRNFINPQIVQHSEERTFGDDLEKPILEGCLSIPNLYGPVPRHTWVKFEYQEIEDGKLITKSETFRDFTARVMQHELDHLLGVLFTDYTLQFELPLYSDTSGKLIEIDRKIAEKF
jgi:peptide deformylase